MKHSLEIAKIGIVGALLLFLLLVSLFAFEGSYTGKATVGTRVNISNSTPANCSFTAYAGLNTVSLPCASTATPIADVVGTGEGIWAMYQYVPGASDPWRVYNPNLPAYVTSDLGFISRRTGYVAVMNETRSYWFEGLGIALTNVPLVEGWQLVGYPSLVTKNASDAFASIASSFSEARTYNTSVSAYETYLNPGGGTLNETVPGEGYWINGTQPGSWAVSGS